MQIDIQVPQGPEQIGMLGDAERNLKMLRESLGVHITARSGTISVSVAHDAVGVAQTVLRRLGDAARHERPLSRREVLDLIAREASRNANQVGLEARLDVFASGKRVEPLSDNQSHYLDAIRAHDLVFATGPAGTGKTYLAVAAAVHLLKADRIRKLMLVR
ncbi:MAG: PhoH family protein, partial [Phycisphaerales bacterium]|nr:PhoH family protein [Phycisphaerales bacterium]